jgi:hypothetical protein
MFGQPRPAPPSKTALSHPPLPPAAARLTSLLRVLPTDSMDSRVGTEAAPLPLPAPPAPLPAACASGLVPRSPRLPPADSDADDADGVAGDPGLPPAAPPLVPPGMGLPMRLGWVGGMRQGGLCCAALSWASERRPPVGVLAPPPREPPGESACAAHGAATGWGGWVGVGVGRGDRAVSSRVLVGDKEESGLVEGCGKGAARGCPMPARLPHAGPAPHPLPGHSPPSGW